MGSFIRWLDHSEEDQRRVREMLEMFRDKGTVDDLGIGTVRDGISNALFPGTSVIQTRARYFLFIPWLFMRAESKYPLQLVAKATDMERRLIDALQTGSDRDGLIGAQVGKNVRNLPSGIFWSGLVRYGIFARKSLSVGQYGRQAARRGVKIDAEDEISDRVPSFWQRDIPDPPHDFFGFQTATFDLTRDEAAWLCERIISSDDPGRASLLSAYVRDLRPGQAPPDAEAPWDLDLPANTSAAVRRLVGHAKSFSCAVNGAALLYNFMLAEARSASNGSTDDTSPDTSPDTYRHLLNEWGAHATRIRLGDWAANTDEFWACVRDNSMRIPSKTQEFIDAFSRVIAAGVTGIESSGAAQALIRQREIEHKRGQARFANKKRLDEWAGKAGTGVLTFRWPQVKRMLRDISGGLAAADTDGDHAVA